MTGSSPEEQAVLEQAPSTLLYAAAKPSAPAEAVEAVKSGDIKSMPEWKAMEAELAAAQKAQHDILAENQELRTDRVSAIDRANNAERRAQAAEREKSETEKERDGAREALTAAKMHAEKWKAEAEAARQVPVPATVVDQDEVDRMAQEKAEKISGPLLRQIEELKNAQSAQADQDDDGESDSQKAYDAVILACRIWDSSWQSAKAQTDKIPRELRDKAREMMLQKLMLIKEELCKCL